MTNDLDLVYQTLDEHGHKFLKGLEMVGAATLGEVNEGVAIAATLGEVNAAVAMATATEVNKRVALAKERRSKVLIKTKEK